jgi:hypothetical protein
MTTIRYIGPHTDGVEVDAIGAAVAHGETIEVADDLGLSLLEQVGNWEAVVAEPEPPKKQKPTTPAPLEDEKP